MILIADSGSTKTDWHFVNPEGTAHSLNTGGLNPYFHTTEDILQILEKDWDGKEWIKEGKKVYFYGAGVSSPQREETVKNALDKFFSAKEYHIHHDLLGAARATCHHEPGITAILGTGSNTCYFDGESIVQEHGGHGYILNDEGGGNHLGKELINAYLDRDLPYDIYQKFEQEYDPDREEIIYNIYQKENASRYLAQFAEFLSKFKSEPFIHNMIANCFVLFFNKHITRYENFRELPVHAVGSVGYHFSEILKKVARQREIQIGRILQSPIDELVKYHQKEEFEK